ncbi:MAG: YgfZ/GcvT domain-containing protein [Beijerinckiaceae bacterium]
MAEALKAVGLPNRGIVRVHGEDARGFLDTLITNSMAGVTADTAIYAALLTPQGKIITDFFIIEAAADMGGGFYCDLPLLAVAEFIKRLTLYKLRAKVTIEDFSEELGVIALWGANPKADETELSFNDPRLPAMGLRVIDSKSLNAAVLEAFDAKPVSLPEYHWHRTRLGIGEAVFDFTLGDAFPHDINMDQLNGVDFRKGCYVGQEIVSRMEHRGTARTRLVQIRYPDSMGVDEGTLLMAADKKLGMACSPARGLSLAMLRLDRAADAVAAGVTITADGLEVTALKPQWWTAAWPIATAPISA